MTFPRMFSVAFAVCLSSATGAMSKDLETMSKKMGEMAKKYGFESIGGSPQDK